METVCKGEHEGPGEAAAQSKAFAPTSAGRKESHLRVVSAGRTPSSAPGPEATKVCRCSCALAGQQDRRHRTLATRRPQGSACKRAQGRRTCALRSRVAATRPCAPVLSAGIAEYAEEDDVFLSTCLSGCKLKSRERMGVWQYKARDKARPALYGTGCITHLETQIEHTPGPAHVGA